MPELFSILIKINVALVLFCGGYYLVLRKLTFYTLNRVYLVVAILLSSVYPFVDLSGFAQQHQQIVEPVQEIVVYWEAPIKHIAKQSSYWPWLAVTFWIGATVFAGRLMLQMLSLYSIYKRSKSAEINGQKVRVVSGDIGPFSFWQSIYINPENLSDTDIKNILEHEQIHVKEWHTLDILLSELSVIFYWFNPGVWMMKKAVRENIEFITDRKILQKGTDSKAYQYSLLSVTFNQPAPAITSNFNFSTLKKRIIMMNAERSSNLNLTRYALLVPVVIVCLLTITLAKAQTLKIDKVFKQITVVVEDIAPVTLNTDTTPVEKKIKLATDKKTKPTKTAEASTEQSISTKPEPLIQALTTGDKTNDSVVIIIDNKIRQNINNVNPNTIKTVSVIKNAPADYIQKMTGLSVQAEGKIKGVINITTSATADSSAMATSAGLNSVRFRNNMPTVIDSTKRFSWKGLPDYKQPVIIVDGEALPDNEKLENINPDIIRSVTVLKDASATKYYGEKAKNGAIIITTKKTKQ